MDEKQYFNYPITEVIKRRISVRTYEPQPLSVENKRKIMEFIDDTTGPFTPKVRFELIDDLSVAENTGKKIGTYGVIRGAKTYILVAVERGDGDLEQVGYILEKVILFATSLGLGTCWLGGTFKREGFERLLELKDQEYMPVITPIGYPQNKKSLIDNIVRFAAGSNKRLKWEQLFYKETLDTPLLKEEISQQYAIALEMVRMAPSASNKQPWRVVKEKDQFHFYLQRNKGYNKTLGFDIQRIDIGIAMCHFEMTINNHGLTGEWINDGGTKAGMQLEQMEYITSFNINSSIIES
ncbi:nitroreductase [Alkaliphilus metalliredigens QYMF]|uniref:Nitroreductase n=1 Tax=Alkaliphilus metalliredigens (strain QYMF) TaxID=293826 RepID=A6TS08_ALKMQ|nr:nitroreductase [Alkaliphilus metalliredigens QYMF]